MIKLYLNNEVDTTTTYVNHNYQWVNNRVEFFRLVLSSVLNNDPIEELINFNELHALTKNSFIKMFIHGNFVSQFHGQNQYDFLLDNTRINPIFNQQYLLDKINQFDEDFLRNILGQRPLNLIETETNFYAGIADRRAINAILIKIFDYSYLRDEAEYGPTNIATNNEIRSCPFCNMGDISFSVHHDPIVSNTADHFFDQAVHPLLAISLFNLIPACFKCNTQLKHNKPFSLETHIHPYIEGFGNYALFTSTQHASKGRIKYQGAIEIIFPDTNPLLRQLVGFDHDDKNLIGNINVFKINETYKTRLSDDIAVLYKKCSGVSNKYIESLGVFLDRITDNEREVYYNEFMNYLDERDFQKKNHSKFFKDIIKERLKISNGVNL